MGAILTKNELRPKQQAIFTLHSTQHLEWQPVFDGAREATKEVLMYTLKEHV